MRVCPWLLRLLIWLTPAMLPRERSSGVATLEAMISGLAPGRLACTVITGKSIFGSGETGKRPKLTLPSSRIARLSNMVATGRAMKGAERFMAAGRRKLGKSALLPASCTRFLYWQLLAAEPVAQSIKEQVDHGRREQRQQLAKQQAANQYQAQRLTQLGTGA